MKSAWRKNGGITGCVAVLALTAIFSMELCAARAAETETKEEGYRPVVFSYVWDTSENYGAWLLGAFRDGGWLTHTALPVLANGRAVSPEESLEIADPIVCTTPLLERGTKLAFYSPNGKIGIASVKETRYSVSAASAESFIDVETDGPELPARTPVVGVGDGWNATPLPTKRTESEDRVIFAAGSGGGGMSATFLSALDEDGEKIYRGTIAFGGKTWPLTDVSVGTPGELDGFFIDLNGDGRMEFLIYCQGIAGFIAAFETGDAGAVEILALDLGD